MTLKAFLQECNKRDVFKRLSIYIVSSWVLIQVLAVTWEPLGITKDSVAFLIIALLLGFPIYIFFQWKYRLAPIYKEELEEADPDTKLKIGRFRRLYFTAVTVISVLSVTVTTFILNNNYGTGTIQIPEVETRFTDKIAILPFGNNTGDPQFDVVGKMAADWIMHGITENRIAQVISPEILDDYTTTEKGPQANESRMKILKEVLKPGKNIMGNYYLSEGKLLIQCSLKNGMMDETLISFKPVSCNSDSPLECIELLKQRILGYLTMRNKEALNLEEVTPKYDAYQYVLNAKSHYNDQTLFLDLLNKAIESDKNYFEPKVLRVGYYFNNKQFEKADSLIRVILPNARNNKRQLNLLNTYRALLDGNNKKIYLHTFREYEIIPFDLATNAGTMVVALQYVNRPQDVDSIYNAISMQGMDLESCTFCQHRLYIQALAKVQLKKYDEAIEIITPVSELVNDFYLKRPLISALVRKKNFAGLDDLFTKLPRTLSEEDLKKAYIYAGKEALLVGEDVQAKVYFDAIIALEASQNDKLYSAYAMLYTKNYKTAEPLFREAQTDKPEDVALLTALATTYQNNGKNKEASEVLATLDGLRTDYQFGTIDYAMARFYAASNDQEKSMNYLNRAIAAGDNYGLQKYQNDHHFIKYWDTPSFKNILGFWH